VSVAADEEYSSYVYTVGFWETLGAPEVVIAGVPEDVANGLLWTAFQEIRDGRLKLTEHASWATLREHGDYVWRQVHPSQWTEKNFATGFWYRHRQAGRPQPPTAFQLVSPGENGRLPWQTDYVEEYRSEQSAFYEPCLSGVAAKPA
jgi:hypothetical protein